MAVSHCILSNAEQRLPYLCMMSPSGFFHLKYEKSQQIMNISRCHTYLYSTPTQDLILILMPELFYL